MTKDCKDLSYLSRHLIRELRDDSNLALAYRPLWEVQFSKPAGRDDWSKHLRAEYDILNILDKACE